MIGLGSVATSVCRDPIEIGIDLEVRLLELFQQNGQLMFGQALRDDVIDFKQFERINQLLTIKADAVVGSHYRDSLFKFWHQGLGDPSRMVSAKVSPPLFLSRL